MAARAIIPKNLDPTKFKAYLNYALFDENMKIVPELSGAYQVGAEGTWGAIGSQGARVIPTNGYLAVYLTNRSNLVATCLSCSNVFFDKLNVEVSKGNLLEENHYYPHGLPIVGLGSTAEGFKENRRRYQGNEYIKDLNLNWMDFNARQYDPQIGRFLGIDPLADDGQSIFSPYAAMGNAPESQVDPNGTKFDDITRSMFLLDLGPAAAFASIGMYLPGGSLYGEHKSQFDGKSWAGMTGQQLESFYAMADNNTKRIIMGAISEPGELAGNLASIGSNGNGIGGAGGANSDGDGDIADSDPQDKKGDSAEKKAEDSQQGYTPAPKDGLPGFPDAGKGGHNKESGRWRWKDRNGDILEWDKQPGK